MFRPYAWIFGLIVVLCGAGYTLAQDADDPVMPPFTKRKDDLPRGFQESLSKARIEKEKKEFNEMLKRGDDALKLAAKLDETSAANQHDQIANMHHHVARLGSLLFHLHNDAAPHHQRGQ